MREQVLTTPFGRRTMSLAMATHQITARAAAPEAAVNKWQVFRHICEARELLGPSDRALVVLNALLSFHPETLLSPADGLVVFPSNVQLSTRAHGMAPATLRRHLATLVELGFIIRRDSPNGKRYARKGAGGDIVAAYGFDLTPLVARAGEFAALAEQVAEQRRQRQMLRERVTLARRDAAKLLQTGEDLCDGDAWRAFRARYEALCAAPPRSAGTQALAERAEALERLHADIANHLEKHLKIANPGGDESQCERHIQNPLQQNSAEENAAPAVPSETPLSLNDVLSACPDILDYAPTPSIRSWNELCAAATVARAALGVSPDQWRSFQKHAGQGQAAAVIAAVLQKRERVQRPTAYLRALEQRIRAGRFSVHPMLRALARERLSGPPQPPAGATGQAATAGCAGSVRPRWPSGDRLFRPAASGTGG